MNHQSLLSSMSPTHPTQGSMFIKIDYSLKKQNYSIQILNLPNLPSLGLNLKLKLQNNKVR